MMFYIILLPIIVALVILFLRMKKRIRELERKMPSTSALEERNRKMKQKKEEYKNKILELLQEKNEISNNDVEKAVGIADSTATKYLQELEDDGKIVQKFETGRGVVYTLK